MKKEDNWKIRFDKEFTRSDELIDKYSWYGVEGEIAPQPTPKAIKQFIQEELDKAREEEWSATRMLWDRMDKWQKEWQEENPKERKLGFNYALKLIEWKIGKAR